MERFTLAILAAGLGSRYGGLKQIDPIDSYGHKIIDFSIYDAMKAGFNKIVFIIKEENEADFRSTIGDVISRHIEVEYVYQNSDNVPDWFEMPKGRDKPWGTAHAILCCEPFINEPFAVINADDYYGVGAFKSLFDFLKQNKGKNETEYSMVGYRLGNTLTEYGYVSRGCCTMDEKGYLTAIDERTHVEKTKDGAAYRDENGNAVPIDLSTLVSMNMWGFYPNVFKYLRECVNEFFKFGVSKNPLKSECFLPIEIGRCMQKGYISVKILSSIDKWFGVTYKEDKQAVEKAIEKLKSLGIYPNDLWK